MGNTASAMSNATGAGQFCPLVLPKVQYIRGLKAFEPAQALQMKNFRKINQQGEPVVKILTYNVWFGQVV